MRSPSRRQSTPLHRRRRTLVPNALWPRCARPGTYGWPDAAWSAKAALAALSPLQAKEHDDWRDAEPGKLPHEVRQGELAVRHQLPFQPAYYGTHDAPALYCLTLWHAWRWTGDDQLVKAHLATARGALHWCDELGDREGDGLLEYATRSSRGYYNQSWKDAGDAVVHADGHQAGLPLATVELQGYLFAARLAMAELLAALGQQDEAERLREAARTLLAIVEDRYWLEQAGFYAFALDGQKQQVASIAFLRFAQPGQRHTCTGYLDHPFKNEPFESEKDLLSLIANSRRSVYNQTSLTASSCLNNAIFT